MFLHFFLVRFLLLLVLGAIGGVVRLPVASAESRALVYWFLCPCLACVTCSIGPCVFVCLHVSCCRVCSFHAGGLFVVCLFARWLVGFYVASSRLVVSMFARLGLACAGNAPKSSDPTVSFVFVDRLSQPTTPRVIPFQRNLTPTEQHQLQLECVRILEALAGF